MSATITTDDGREFSKPEKVPFMIKIGRRRRPDKGYITDEQMVLTAPCGWLLKESIPQPLKQYIDSPEIESKSGDNRKWVCPNGHYMQETTRPERWRNKEVICKGDAEC